MTKNITFLFCVLILSLATSNADARSVIKCFPPKPTYLVWHSDADIAFYGRLKIEKYSRSELMQSGWKQMNFEVVEPLKGLPSDTKEVQMNILSVNFFTGHFSKDENQLIGGKFENGVLSFEPVVHNGCISEQEVLDYMRLPYFFQMALIVTDAKLMNELLVGTGGLPLFIIACILLMFLSFRVINRRMKNKEENGSTD